MRITQKRRDFPKEKKDEKQNQEIPRNLKRKKKKRKKEKEKGSPLQSNLPNRPLPSESLRITTERGF